MRLQKKLAIFLITVITLSNAICSPESKPIKKGESSPFDGVVLNKEMAESHRKELLKKDILDQDLYLCNEKLTLCEIKLEHSDREMQQVLKDSEKLKEEIGRERKMSGFVNALWAVLGIFTGGVVVYLGSKLSR